MISWLQRRNYFCHIVIYEGCRIFYGCNCKMFRRTYDILLIPFAFLSLRLKLQFLAQHSFFCWRHRYGNPCYKYWWYWAPSIIVWISLCPVSCFTWVIDLQSQGRYWSFTPSFRIWSLEYGNATQSEVFLFTSSTAILVVFRFYGSLHFIC